MKNHTLKIENLPFLTEELSNDKLAAVKGGQPIIFGFALEVLLPQSSISQILALELGLFPEPPPIIIIFPGPI